MWERKKRYMYVQVPIFASTSEGLYKKTCTAYIQFKGKTATREIRIPEDHSQPVQCIYVKDVNCAIQLTKKTAKDLEKYPEAVIDSEIFLRLWRLHRGKENDYGIQLYNNGTSAMRGDAVKLRQTMSHSIRMDTTPEGSIADINGKPARTISLQLLTYGRNRLGVRGSSSADISSQSGGSSLMSSCTSSTTGTLDSSTNMSQNHMTINTPERSGTPLLGQQISRQSQQSQLYADEHEQYVFNLLQSIKKPHTIEKQSGLDFRDTIPPPSRLPPSISGLLKSK
ncbi:hypothetical protein SARC_06352 [Sphaeroforma arctica JP610]|uniref:Uncharacterized protein n=1 Tax=Sphaeroforma arctica JP610 TaxID=667725 RepID=A0A0L0FWW0_9EUKA|nr:hypothetical protein SARC_06352 [Sphaeroforma arctica JP610]KNC81317.1 hypothetical protein SARC_06352 [Sphaeroforma arctica JP610]|eukprot:XP_014155219.1 hypothetical protein SARC_06352 [Sphaeroforma arctica JP610]